MLSWCRFTRGIAHLPRISELDAVEFVDGEKEPKDRLAACGGSDVIQKTASKT